MQVVLASTSPARLALLQSAGIPPRTLAPSVDEESLIRHLEAAGHCPSPAEIVQTLAVAKAQDVAGRLHLDRAQEAMVIGGDSMFELGGTLFGKPLIAEVARGRWRDMRGQTGVLHSGLSVIHLGAEGRSQRADGVDSASVTFASDVEDGEIDAYVATGEPLHVAGAFTIDALAAGFIERIDGAPSAVVGMSLPLLRRLVRSLGVSWTDLWSNPGSAAREVL